MAELNSSCRKKRQMGVLTMPSEVKEGGEVLGGVVVVTRIRQPSIGIPQLIEEGVTHGLDRRQSLGGGVLE